MGDYPQHEKLAEKRLEHKAITRFLDWLMESESYRIKIEKLLDEDPEIPFETEEDRWHWLPGRTSFAELVAEHFEIDPVEFEKEKEAMLDELRAGGEKK